MICRAGRLDDRATMTAVSSRTASPMLFAEFLMRFDAKMT